MSAPDGTLLAGIPPALHDELATELVAVAGARIERILSPPGYSSPDGFWYDQPHAEWVTVLAGSAGLLFEGEPEPRPLRAGDYALIPAHARHRVAWTDPQAMTVWLAVHLPISEAG